MPTLIQPTAVRQTIIVQPTRPAPTPRWKEPDQAPAPIPERIPDDQPPASWFSLPRALAIGGAIAVLVAVGYLVNPHSFSTQTKPLVPAAEQLEKSPVSRTQEPPPKAPPTTNIPSRPAANGGHEKVASPNPVKPPNPIVASDPGKSPAQPPVPKPATKPHGCTIDGDEIAGYLGLADRYRSRGNYDRAISDYNIVLGCEPGNRQAQAGLRNAVDAEKYTSQ